MNQDRIFKYSLVGVGMYVIIGGIVYTSDKNVDVLYCPDRVRETRYKCEKRYDNGLSDYLNSRLVINDTTSPSAVSFRII